MAEIGTVNSLVAELTAGGRAKANNVVKLLALMASCKHEAALKSAVQGLKQFFVAAGQDGLLLAAAAAAAAAASAAARPAKRQKVAAPSSSAAPSSDPESQYREWLGRQYGTFVNTLLGLVTGWGPAAAAAGPASPPQQPPQPSPLRAPSAGVQVVAAAALMECVRSELGPGVFSGALYGRLLSGVLLSPAVRPEVFSLLFSRHLAGGAADVRFHTLAAVRALAGRHGGGGGQQLQAEEEEDEEEEAGTSGAAAAAAAAVSGSSSGSGVAVVALPDLARSLFDVLRQVPEALPEEAAQWSSWCGAAEFNLVTAATDKNESARSRRKRKQQEAEQAGPVAAAAPQQRRVQWANPRTQQRLYGEAWLSLLSLPLPADTLRRALVALPAALPHLPAPHLLADFLTHCLNRGGLTGMLALNGLFLLVTRHGLEYPQFFARLYQLLVPEAFVARSRAQFFRLADLFLSSALVPAYTVAAFVKRFARLALTAPPAGALVATAFVHNLVRRHPALASMMHRPEGGAGKGAGGEDVYDEAEADPAKSRAVESSLWEVEALRNHYCPQVSTFCAVLDKDLTDRTKTAEVNLEDLLGAAGPDGQQAGGAGSYNALIHGELSRKLRKAPVAFYGQPPASLFDANGDAEDWGGWTF